MNFNTSSQKTVGTMGISEIAILSGEPYPFVGGGPNCVIINSATIILDHLLNERFFQPAEVSRLSETFRNNTPFPHFVFDGLFSPALLDLMNTEFDDLKNTDWRLHYSDEEIKLGSKPNIRLGHATRLYFNTVYSGPFVHFLEQISGIKPLITDPSLCNGGLHEMPTGGKFSVHTDFNQHEETGLCNRLAFITYLNKDWLPSYGGSLELWNAEENKCEVEVQPIFGRSVLFLHSPRSQHGLPKPICAPDGRPRRSALAYFYSTERFEAESDSFHPTLYFNKATPGLTEKLKNAIKQLTPPVIVEAAWGVKMFLRRKLIDFKKPK